MDFTPGREQDASATIRGFKYQIQLTLKRWLELGEGEDLYLECGEDIDRVLAVGDPSGVQRELEQIKARSRKITLRSDESLAVLANFAAHIAANPTHSLRFRFTTTSLPGREKLSTLEKGTKGIEAWEQLRSKNIWDRSDHAVANQIARLILDSS